jgi:hypothetical protein
MDVCLFLFVVLSCVGRGLGAGLIPRPAKESYQMSKGSISKKEIPTPEKGIRKMRKKKKKKHFPFNIFLILSMNERQFFSHHGVVCFCLERQSVQLNTVI